ncbi:hypothetical protein EDD15DRAFT_2239605 [Pisolithus albus]|nr:hypothetical protein EDD15DRAFT_2239605 [Pisolithus albus]
MLGRNCLELLLLLLRLATGASCGSTLIWSHLRYPTGRRISNFCRKGGRGTLVRSAEEVPHSGEPTRRSPAHCFRHGSKIP